MLLSSSLPDLPARPPQQAPFSGESMWTQALHRHPGNPVAVVLALLQLTIHAVIWNKVWGCKFGHRH